MSKKNRNKERELTRQERVAAIKKSTKPGFFSRFWFPILMVFICAALLGTAMVPVLKDKANQERIAKLDVADIGVSAKDAGCTTKTEDAKPGVHITPGTPIEYKTVPSHGDHWPNYLMANELRSMFYTEDRPPMERLVHELEHGYSILYYDATLKSGSKDFVDLQNIARKISYKYNTKGLIIAPWSKVDGVPLDGKFVLAHWRGDKTAVETTCSKVSGEAAADFVKKYPYTDSPEPGAM